MQGKKFCAHKGLNQINNVGSNADFVHGLLHDKGKVNDGHGGDHIAEAVHGQVASLGQGHDPLGDIQEQADSDGSYDGQETAHPPR